MNYLALDPLAGTPRPGDLMWSALPDAPVCDDGRAPVEPPARDQRSR